MAEALLAQDGVAPIGLGARDSLRLEAGLCLYGSDLDETTSPVEGALDWAIQKARRRGGAREGGFPGADRILNELEERPLASSRRAPSRRPRADAGRNRAFRGQRPAARPSEPSPRAPSAPRSTGPCRWVTSPPPTPLPGTRLFGEVRGKRLPAIITPMPFHPNHLQALKRDQMKFTEEHEWLMVEGDLVVVGITEHAATQLGDIVFVELPEIETMVARGDEVCVIESVKAASDILAPLEGEIVEVNDKLTANPGLVNEDPLGEAWFFKMKIDDLSALDEYMDEDEYKDFIE